MSDYNIHKEKGVIHKVYDTDFIQTKKGLFPKRVVVVEVRSDKGGYDRTALLALDIFGDKAHQYDHYLQGDEVEFSYTIQSRMSTKNGDERWWTSLNMQTLAKKFENQGATHNSDVKFGDKISDNDDKNTGLPF
jgi:hypothetical protein